MKERLKGRGLAYGVGAVLLLGLFGLWLFLGQGFGDRGGLQEVPVPTAEASGEAEPQEIVVHITGAVASPGVFRLPQGARLIDAVDAAGGLTAEASTDQINLAALLSDADKIHIYTLAEAAQGQGGVAADGRVNINTASLEELMTLPGIGEGIGGNIIAYREKNGAFRSLEALKEVDRIGDKLFERIRELICL
ncbi:MAG: ComEA family DNA-binding protein [Eubacterium sp.]|nr:ComEA family DNA-binding protein [Eubacterium sp.]